MKRVLITGVTGFLGRNILYRHLEEVDEGKREKEKIVVLARGNGKRSASERVERLLASRYEGERLKRFKTRIELLEGDMEHPKFGLSDASYEKAATGLNRIVHAAATVTLDLPLAEARAINVGGTERILDLAAKAYKKGSLERVDYIGTAYVAGTREGKIYEDELDKGQDFHNTYERTKFEAEKLVRERWKDVPVAIHRPSIIVGESSTGKTTSFKVIYFPMRIYASGLWRWVPGRKDAPVDIVPIDFVTEAFMRISESSSTVGKCYHLTASGSAATMGGVADLASSYFKKKPVKFINPWFYMNVIHPTVKALLFGRLYDILINKGSLYLPYIMSYIAFDNNNALKHLNGCGIEVPKVGDYFSRIFQFCIDSDWGKKVPESRSV